MSVTTKSMIINNDFLTFTQNSLIQLFKPVYNPKLGHFPLQTYGYDTKFNSIRNKYNTPNVVSGLFLVTENFLKFIDRINDFWYIDNAPRVITPVTYTSNAAGDILLLAADTSRQAELLGIFEDSTGNYAAKFSSFENSAKIGVMGNAGSDGCCSSSIPELFLRHLYSTDPAKREVAFKLAKNFYGFTTIEVDSAKLEMIPADDFDSDLFTTTLVGDVLTLSYSKPIHFQTKYLETVHNVSKKPLYLYFPLITSNALRDVPTNVDLSTKEQLHELISIYTGITNVQGTLAPTGSDFGTYFKQTATYRPKNPSTGGGISGVVTNRDMPTLTNSIWSNTKDKSVYQAGYTAVSITEAGGGGDIIFDHTDKIEYIDSLTLKIKVPTVYS